MTLRLNNQEVLGQEMKINIKLPFGDSDLSGQGSGTDTAEQGMKAKELTVSMLIRFDKVEWLTSLTDLAESLEENGSRTIYRIGNDAAEAMKFYQAKFTGEVNLTEQESINAWSVTFTLTEVLSVPERKAQRDEIKPAKQQTVNNNDGDTSTGDDPNIPPNTDLTMVEQFLKYADNALGAGFNFFEDEKEDQA